jgi:DNA mismatch repair protein MSH4
VHWKLNFLDKYSPSGQVVLLTILAQIGCRVPAESATFRIPDRIFSRVSNRDCIETNSSTFMVEMQETSFILANVGPTSLVIIDELGRGTSVDEGSAICWAVAERLLESKAFVFLATHFSQMASLAELHPCAASHHFQSAPGEAGAVEPSHQLVDGRAPSSALHYGLELASRSLPDALVARARQLVTRVRRRAEPPLADAGRTDAAFLRALVQLKRLRRLGLQGDELAESVGRVREQLRREALGGTASQGSVEGEGTASQESSGGEGAPEGGVEVEEGQTPDSGADVDLMEF